MTSVLITGASSGIGAALALAYAAPGVRLALCGRDAERLEDTAVRCRAAGADVACRVLCVTEASAVAAWVAEADAAAPLDVVIANAGISAGTGGGAETAEQTRAIFAVNVDGVLNTVLPAVEALRARGRGQIGIVASVAGFRGLPSAPAYCASKAAVKAWGEGLRGWLAPQGVGVSVILPGFVESRITAANRFRMPLLMPADRAARLIRRGLDRNVGRIAFPMPTVFVGWLMSVLPNAVVDRLTRGLPGK